jgi:hypothetical protein
MESDNCSSVLEFPVTQYQLSLCDMAATCLYVLPNGWFATFGDLIDKLREVEHPCRADVQFDGITIQLGELHLAPRFPDRVVHGIIRKFSKKLASTCTRCGRPGRQRRWGLTQLPLCASCYGLSALRVDIKQLLEGLEDEDPNQTDVIVEADLAPRIRLLLADSWQEVQPGGRGIGMRCMSSTALKREAPRLRSLLLELDRQLDGMTGTKPSTQGDCDDR